MYCVILYYGYREPWIVSLGKLLLGIILTALFFNAALILLSCIGLYRTRSHGARWRWYVLGVLSTVCLYSYIFIKDSWEITYFSLSEWIMMFSSFVFTAMLTISFYRRTKAAIEERSADDNSVLKEKTLPRPGQDGVLQKLWSFTVEIASVTGRLLRKLFALMLRILSNGFLLLKKAAAKFRQLCKRIPFKKIFKILSSFAMASVFYAGLVLGNILTIIGGVISAAVFLITILIGEMRNRNPSEGERKILPIQIPPFVVRVAEGVITGVLVAIVSRMIGL